MADVFCVGILCVDVLAKPVNRWPEKGKLNQVEQIRLDIGGCAANAAIVMSRLGLDVSLGGKIGNDDFGSYLAAKLNREGVHTQGLRVDDGVSTSASVVAVDSDGERSILHCSGANASLRFEDIRLDELKKSKLLFITGVFLMRSFDGSDAACLLREARRNDLVCCCDTAWDSTGQWLKTIREMLPLIDWFLPSYDEAVGLSGLTEPAEIADFLQAQGTQNVVVKLGDKGCYVREKKQSGFYVPAVQGIDAVDTSGAGDAFCAGFITGLIRGFSVHRAAELANAAGASCIMEMGTTSGVHSLEQTMMLLNHSGAVT